MEVLTATLQLTCILLLMIAWCFVLILKPIWVWKLEHWLGSKRGAPSTRYLTLVRAGGVLLLVLCIGAGVLFTAKLF